MTRSAATRRNSGRRPRPGCRGIGLVQATSLNVANMVGVGPFITIPLFVAAMGGPQALVGWIVAAVLVLCDGLVWSELGAALPGSGGTYHFLREIYGRYPRRPADRVSVHLAIPDQRHARAGLAAISARSNYLAYAVPGLQTHLRRVGHPQRTEHLRRDRRAAGGRVAVPPHQLAGLAGRGAVRRHAGHDVDRDRRGSGQLQFGRCSSFRPTRFAWTSRFFIGLGGAMLIAIYDYLGYYNVCHLGDEVIEPEKTYPAGRDVFGR